MRFSIKDKNSLNGDPERLFNCPIAEEWEPTKLEVKAYMETANVRLGEIAQAIKESNLNLIGPATGRKQIPLEVVISLIVFWGVYMVFAAVKDSNKDFKLNWTDGLVISESKEIKNGR